MIMINKICDKACTHTNVILYIYAVDVDVAAAVSSGFFFFVRTFIFVSHRNPTAVADATAAFFSFNSSTRQDKEESHQKLDGVQFYLFFKLKFFQIENSFCFAQNYHLLDETAAAAAAALEADYTFIYLMPLN